MMPQSSGKDELSFPTPVEMTLEATRLGTQVAQNLLLAPAKDGLRVYEFWLNFWFPRR